MLIQRWGTQPLHTNRTYPLAISHCDWKWPPIVSFPLKKKLSSIGMLRYVTLLEGRIHESITPSIRQHHNSPKIHAQVLTSVCICPSWNYADWGMAADSEVAPSSCGKDMVLVGSQIPQLIQFSCWEYDMYPSWTLPFLTNGPCWIRSCILATHLPERSAFCETFRHSHHLGVFGNRVSRFWCILESHPFLLRKAELKKNETSSIFAQRISEELYIIWGD